MASEAIQPNRIDSVQISKEELERIRASYQKRERSPISQILGRVGFWALVIVIILYTLFPFYWAVVSSISPTAELIKSPVSLYPKRFTLDHYEKVFASSAFTRALLNSAIVSGSVVILALLFGTLGAYAMGRLQFRGRTLVLYLILSMTMFPAISIVGSLFTMMNDFNAFNTLWGLIVVYLTFSLPFTVWVLTNFFRAMPAELEQAALVDGATPMRALKDVLLPLAVPGMVTTALLGFIGAWSEFLYARSFTRDETAKTVQVAISEFTGNQQFETPYGVRMAAAVVVTVPLLIGVLIVQRRIIAGLTAGAVKG